MNIFDIDGSKIRVFREALGWSRERLSEESGVPPRTIQDIETMKVENPGLETLKPLLMAMEPFHPEIQKNAEKRAEQLISIIAGVGTLNEDQLNFVSGYIAKALASRTNAKATS